VVCVTHHWSDFLDGVPPTKRATHSPVAPPLPLHRLGSPLLCCHHCVCWDCAHSYTLIPGLEELNLDLGLVIQAYGAVPGIPWCFVRGSEWWLWGLFYIPGAFSPQLNVVNCIALIRVCHTRSGYIPDHQYLHYDLFSVSVHQGHHLLSMQKKPTLADKYTRGRFGSVSLTGPASP
jgi:hypothetical protein